MTAKYKMSRSSKITMWVVLPLALGAVQLMIWYLFKGVTPAQDPRNVRVTLDLLLSGVVVLAWVLLFLAIGATERREAKWKAGAQARREAAIRNQWERMAEVNRLVDKYGMDIGIVAYLLDEDPEEVERVVG